MIFYSVKEKNRTEYMIMMNPSTSVSKIACRHELLHNNSCPVVSYCLISVWKRLCRNRLFIVIWCCLNCAGVVVEMVEGVLSP